MSSSQSRQEPGVMMRCWIILLMLLMFTQCLADAKSNQNKSQSNRKKEFLEQIKNGFLSFRLENSRELLQALSSFRQGELEQAQEYAWLLSMYACQESDKVLAFVEDELPDAIASTENNGKALEFFEYYLDIAIWDLWQKYDVLDTKEKKQVMGVLNAIKNYRQIYPRKIEANLAKDLKTIFPGELNSGINYTAQAKQILSILAPVNSLD